MTIHIGPVGTSYATPGHVFLDGDLLSAWGAHATLRPGRRVSTVRKPATSSW